MTRPLLLVAAGGLGRETAEAARAGDTWEPAGFIDDDPDLAGTDLDGVPVLGGLVAAVNFAGRNPDAGIVLCAGKGRSRLKLAARLADMGLMADRYATVTHPAVSVPPSCRVGPGSILLAGTVLTTGVDVGQHVVCMPNVVLTHDDVVEDAATLCAGVVLGGGVTVGTAAYLGMGSSVRENVTLGPDSVVGMGAVVLDDVPPGSTAVGVPAVPLDSRRRGLRVAVPE